MLVNDVMVLREETKQENEAENPVTPSFLVCICRTALSTARCGNAGSEADSIVATGADRYAATGPEGAGRANGDGDQEPACPSGAARTGVDILSSNGDELTMRIPTCH